MKKKGGEKMINQEEKINFLKEELKRIVKEWEFKNFIILKD